MKEDIVRQRSVIFPWEDVDACGHNNLFFKAFGQVLKNDNKHKSCPQCGKPSEQLRWIWFSSPSWTWDNFMGQAGYMSICDKCHRQVDFICVMRN